MAYEETGVTSVEGDDDKALFQQSMFYHKIIQTHLIRVHRLNFQIPVNSNVTLTIYNLLGQVVTTLVNEEVSAGHYSTVWNGADDNGLSGKQWSLPI